MLSLVAMGFAAELLLPGSYPAEAVQGVEGPGWLALRGNKLEAISVSLQATDQGQRLAVPEDVVVLLRGEPFVAGPVRTLSTANPMNASIKVGELQLLREGERILVSDGERRQRLELGGDVSLVWAGDLDQDGRTDLIFSRLGVASLWLSSGTPYLLRRAAGYDDAGC